MLLGWRWKKLKSIIGGPRGLSIPLLQVHNSLRNLSLRRNATYSIYLPFSS